MPLNRRSVALLSSATCLLIPGLLLPILEVNSTHLFHPDWPPHARMHEAWQLITNGAFAWVGLAIACTNPESRVPHGIGLTISASFVAAWILRDQYGGTMGDASSANLAIAGFDVAVIVMGIASVLHVIGFATRNPKTEESASNPRDTLPPGDA